MNVKIYKPSKTAMQAGLAKTGQWVLEYETETPRNPEALMGWVASGDTLNQVRLEFKTAQDAIDFAQSKGWDYTVAPQRNKRVKPQNYADNFRYTPPEDSASG
jgi:hypothetical protein